MLETASYTVIIILCITMIYPFWNLVVISFNDGADTAKGGLTLLPRVFTLENYRFVFQDARLVSAFGISVARTVTVTVFASLITSLFAYAISRRELKFRKTYIKLCTVTMYINGGLIPTFLVMREFRLVNTFWALVIPMLFSVWNMIIFRSFFDTLPDGIIEAAKIDGAGEYQVFFRIVLPVSKPVLATLALFTAVGQWNAWFDGAIYISAPNLIPLQTLLRQIINTNATSQIAAQIGGTAAEKLTEANITTRSLSSATMMVMTIPIMIVYPFLQKYFTSGIMIGAIKE